MNYAYQYFKIIANRKQHPLTKIGDGSIERHHIIPKSEGGSNTKDNLVNLTAREHFICHRLLAKIYDDTKMRLAVFMMIHGNEKVKDVHVSSRTYSRLRQDYAEDVSKKMKGRYVSNETRQRMSKASIGREVSKETRNKISQKALGNNRATGKRTLEQRKRMSIAQKVSVKCKAHRDAWNAKQGKRIVQMDLSGNVIASYKSIREADRITGIDRSQISKCCQGITNHKSAKGFIWKYE